VKREPRLRGIERISQLADATLALMQAAKDAKPRRLSNSLEELEPTLRADTRTNRHGLIYQAALMCQVGAPNLPKSMNSHAICSLPGPIGLNDNSYKPHHFLMPIATSWNWAIPMRVADKIIAMLL
jgi:hypothetical protein